MLVKRIWSRNTKVLGSNSKIPEITIDVWDSGSRRFERWSNGIEYSWELISRELTESGFIEILSKLSNYETPMSVVSQERLQILGAVEYSEGQEDVSRVYHLPGWSVIQEVEEKKIQDILPKASYNTQVNKNSKKHYHQKYRKNS